MVTSHKFHERDDEVLEDACRRCTEHSWHPLQTLDRDHLTRLWEEMLAVEFTQEEDAYRSRNDARACRELYEIATFIRYYPELVGEVMRNHTDVEF